VNFAVYREIYIEGDGRGASAALLGRSSVFLQYFYGPAGPLFRIACQGATHYRPQVQPRLKNQPHRAAMPRLSRNCPMSTFQLMASRAFAIAACSFAVAASATAQTAPAAAALKVGDMAPDFTVTAVTSSGVNAKPFKLSEHKGETVVLAFFPKARTSGCTMQMHAYRDKYETLFKNGKKVTVVGVSVDSDTALISWAKDDKIPFHFAADVDRKVGVAYGANAGTGFHKRFLYVIDPKGKISYVATPFLQASEDAYTELGAAVNTASGTK
jgi:peroxiredoxin Q/BCP